MDWKYIPRKDKISFTILLSVILLFSAINFYLTRKGGDISISTVNNDSIKWFYNTQVLDRDMLDQRNKDGILDINTVSYESLLQLCSNDTMTTSQIISYRNRLRGFNTLSQLIDIRTINQQRYIQLIDSLSILSPHDSIYINTETFESLLQHPYLNYSQCLVITDIRARKAPIHSLKRLALLYEFREKDIKQLQPYISFSTKTPN